MVKGKGQSFSFMARLANSEAVVEDSRGLWPLIRRGSLDSQAASSSVSGFKYRASSEEIERMLHVFLACQATIFFVQLLRTQLLASIWCHEVSFW